MARPEGARDQRSALFLLLLGAVVLFAFQLIGRAYYESFQLDLGSGGRPEARYTAFLALWAFLGTVSATAITAGCVTLLRRRATESPRTDLLTFGSDRMWVAAALVFGLLVPVAIRLWVLDSAPLTDDESSYRFTAQLLASGHLVGESPPGKLFWDRSFMINDGRFYSQYFLGWPALMVPFLWLGLSGFANAFYSAVTAPGVYLAARRLAGREGARLAILMYLTSPFLMVGAATELSHTTCLGALVWMTWAALRSRDPEAGALPHTLVGLLFCVAFWVRPLSAIGVGLPVLVWWGIGALRRPSAERLRAIAACAVPCVVLGGLFLTVNAVQNGSPTRFAYQVALDYARDNGFRFTHWKPTTMLSVTLDPGRATIGLANAGVALFRLNGATFGWPFSLLLVPLAWRVRGAGVQWAALATFFAVHWTVVNIGIDSFGPVHYLEVVWPVILLSTLGVVRLAGGLAQEPAASAARWAAAPSTLVLVMIVLATLGYLPTRFRALRQITAVNNLALRAPARQGIDHAIVFTPRYITENCDRQRPDGWMHWRPNPDPAFEDSILWANHITVEEDRRYMATFPDRSGYIFGWARGCIPVLLPLDDPRADLVPPGPM